jgi:hypothetical protein
VFTYLLDRSKSTSDQLRFENVQSKIKIHLDGNDILTLPELDEKIRVLLNARAHLHKRS